MTEYCGQIAADLLKTCIDPLVQGVQDEIIIINKADIDTVTRNNTNSQIVEGITLVASSPAKTAFKAEGINYSIDAEDSLKLSDYGWGFPHKVVFRVFQNDPDNKKTIEDMVGGKYVVIVKNNYENRNKVGTPSDSLYEIYGLDNGLVIPDGGISRNKSDDSTKGAYVITLESHAKAPEPHLPATFFITDKATTKLAVDALL